MRYRDPTQQILKAYYNLLNGSVFYNDSIVRVGTRIPKRTNNYVLIYIEDMGNMDTGKERLYNVVVAMQIVSMQNVTEGDDEVVNTIQEQVIELVDDPDSFIMDGFRCLTAKFENSEYDTEMTDSSYNIIRKLRMSNFIEQIQ
jgi:hypothetical protein